MSTATKLTIETPEQTALEFPLAGIGSRFLALAGDTAIQLGVAGLLALIAGSIVPIARLLGSLSEWMLALLTIGGFLIYEAYFAFFEAVWNGQTPGKRLARLRVIRDDGRPIGVYDSIARNLLRIVDQLPGIYVVGIVAMLFSSQNKRLGDFVAGTVVVHEKALEGVRPFGPSGAEPSVAATLPAFDASRISLAEFQLIEVFLQRRETLETDVRRSKALQIVERIAQKLGVAAGPWPSCEGFLEAVYEQARTKGLRA